MKERFEQTYGSAVRSMMTAVNPVKKKILKTHCTIHKFINMQAVEILRSEGYIKEHEFYHRHIKLINEGVTWADQDFKSSNHFYHFSKGKGLFGFSDAMSECLKYYREALINLNLMDLESTLFYFGAALHLIQDCTVPHHVNNRLLKNHRNFEMWIIKKFLSDYSFHNNNGILRYRKPEDYIKNNALTANNLYLKFINIEDKEERYGKIAPAILKEAQSTTAGFMLDFYGLVDKKNII